MEDTATIINILKQLKTDYKSIVRYCGTSSKVRKICIQYAKDIFGRQYNDIIYMLAINKYFPTLEEQYPIEVLLNFYGNFADIWRELLLKKTIEEEFPMCGNIDFDSDILYDPKNPANLALYAPYHRPIYKRSKTLTFIFFRHNDKIPTNVFTYSSDKPITTYTFIYKINQEYSPQKIDSFSENFIFSQKNRYIWERYINDPYWETPDIKKYYPKLTLNEEFEKIKENSACYVYLAVGFRESEIAKLIRKYFNIFHPAIEIEFNT